MNSYEREELERLKLRQVDLADRMGRLQRDIQQLEAHLLRSDAAPAPVNPTSPPAETVAAAPLALPPIIPVPAPAEAAPVPAGSPVELPRRRVLPVLATPVLAEPVPPSPATLPPVAPVPPSPAGAPPKSFELQLGTFWLVRIGIVMILGALGLVGLYAYQHVVPRLGPGAKVGLLYLASGLLAGVGAWLQRKTEAALRNYGMVVLAGGLAAIYFTTYAAWHIPNLRVVPSAWMDGVLLLACAGGIVALADRRRSEVLALFAIVLAYFTSIITQVGLFTLYSNLVLTLAGGFFLIRHRWARLSFASLIGTYGGYAFWRFYADGHWHLVSPAEGLWTGNYFLVCYWVLFTVAPFWSRSEQFHGPRRAGFVTLNNGAFTSAFLLTMLQVNSGQFHVFAFVFGGVLAALAVLAARLRPDDRSFRNTYLTQGLLLVTLGCLTYFAGLHLSLILGAESLLLMVLGRQLESRVLRGAAYPVAGLAVFWAATLLEPFNRGDLGSAVFVGALLLGNAWVTRQEPDHAPLPMGPRGLYFTAGAVVIWLVATWRNTTPEQLPLVLAGECLLFLAAAGPLGNRALGWAGRLVAGLATVAGLVLLADTAILALAVRPGAGRAVALGGLLVGAALLCRRVAPPAGRTGSVTWFSGLGLLVWLVALLVHVAPPTRAAALAVAAAALTLGYYPTRLREAAYGGQVFLVVGLLAWLVPTVNHGHLPWWNPATLLVITLGLGQWWQRQRSVPLPREARQGLAAVAAVGVVGLLYLWLPPLVSAPHWLLLAAGLAVALTAYGLALRSWLMAVAGQFFLAVSVWELARQLEGGGLPGPAALVPLAVLAGLSVLTVRGPAAAAAGADAAAGLRTVGRAYRITAAVLLWWWVGVYVPAPFRSLALAGIALTLFLLAGRWRQAEALALSGAFAAALLAGFWIAALQERETTLWQLAALLVVPVLQGCARRRPERYPLTTPLHNACLAAGGLTLWFWLSRWVDARAGGFYLTASWSGLALLIFVAGMGLRERGYRWLGLAILGCALARGLLIDLRTMELIYRILSVLALGVVLLVLGFLYNKYQDRLKDWL